MRQRFRGAWLGVAAIVCAMAAGAEAPTSRPVTIWSEGIPLAGDLWLPAPLAERDAVPGMLLVHGWGGIKSHLNAADAPQFAALGYVVLTFDYRGWGESPGMLVRKSAGKGVPRPDELTEVRELVDPLAFLEDIRNALAFLMGEPRVDRNRLAVWGSSLGGGLALQTAIEFPAVRVLISQIGNVNPRAGIVDLPDASPLSQPSVLSRRIGIARGELPPFPGAESALPGLRGTMDWGKFRRWDPFARVDELEAATLVIDAADEELFDIAKNGHALYEAVKDRLTARYEVLPGKHYDLYRGESYEKALALESEWLQRHLRPAPTEESSK